MKDLELSAWKKTIPDKMKGDKLYLRRAREAFPILVRQAKARNPISYGDLAKELNMPNPRNLNYVLGAIGTFIENLEQRNSGIQIPALSCIVIGQQSRLPGDGIDWFISIEDFKKLSPNEKRKVVNDLLGSIYSYQNWDWVLKECDLEPSTALLSESKREPGKEKGSGDSESQSHLAFKNFIANNPELLGVSNKATSEIEYELPSQDRIDVCFSFGNELIGVEVKSFISDPSDIWRGIFQCVKYQALLEAKQVVFQGVSNCRVILAIEGKLPEAFIKVKNQLGISVLEFEPLSKD